MKEHSQVKFRLYDTRRRTVVFQTYDITELQERYEQKGREDIWRRERHHPASGWKQMSEVEVTTRLKQQAREQLYADKNQDSSLSASRGESGLSR